MLDTACAVEFLHENGVLYRDLKPDNLLVFSVSHNANVNCKLSDFGTARTVEDPAELRAYSSGIGACLFDIEIVVCLIKTVLSTQVRRSTWHQSWWMRRNTIAKSMCTRLPCVVGSWWLRNNRFTKFVVSRVFNTYKSKLNCFFSVKVKRVWDLPRIVVDGLRPTIDDTCKKEKKKTFEMFSKLNCNYFQFRASCYATYDCWLLDAIARTSSNNERSMFSFSFLFFLKN